MGVGDKMNGMEGGELAFCCSNDEASNRWHWAARVIIPCAPHPICIPPCFQTLPRW